MLVAMTDWQKQFENLATKPDPKRLRNAVLAARANKAEGRDGMLGAMTWAAFSCPSATQAVYDLIAQTWLTPDAEVKASFSDDWAEAPISADFWVKFWEAVEGPSEGYDALTITQAIAALGGAVDESFGPLAEQCANAHPGADDAAEKTVPGLLDLQALSECPAGSLGHELCFFLREQLGLLCICLSFERQHFCRFLFVDLCSLRSNFLNDVDVDSRVG